MNAPFNPTRRGFLATGGLTIGLALPLGRAAAQGAAPAATLAPNAFVRIGTDDLVTIVIKHIEFGQGPATGLATLLADELDADWSQVRVEMSPANDPLYKNIFFNTMGTGGSTAIANSFMQMRSAGASARAMLVEAAAKRWGVPASTIKVSKGVVSSGSRKARFGELAADAAALTPPAKPVLKTPDQWTLIGTDVPKVDSAIKTDGSAKFTMDIARPDMVHTAIAHAPAFGGTVRGVDKAAALAVPGVVAVEALPMGVVVYAKDTFAAMRGRAALSIDWDLSKAETRSSADLYRTYAAAAATPGIEVHKTGDAAAALAGAARTIEATYHFPFLAHAPMEPMDAVIERQGDGSVDVWMGSQFQVGEMRALAGTLGVPFEKLTLHQQYAGGSFGRRATPDMEFAVEAASIAKAYKGKGAVKHVWTRENDIRGGRYRPLAVHRVKGGIDATGNIVGLDHVVAIQSFMLGTPMEALAAPGGKDASMTEGLDGVYAIPNHRVGAHRMMNGVPTLWWRSVGHTHTGYALETFLDELIAAGGKDPLAARLALLTDPRGKAVLTRAAEIAKWGRKPPPGRALGIAYVKSFGSYVAQVAEVSEGKDGLPRVHKIWCAVDCGIAVNPNIIRAQMEGGIGYGIGHALYGEIALGAGGIVEAGNFDAYRSLRIGEMPDVEVSIIASTANPTGVGEPGLPPAAPAVANAWRTLTGKTLRRQPFSAGEMA